MTKTDYIFCGLPRNPERWVYSLELLSKLRDEGLIENVVFSTWINESKSVKHLIDKYKVILIEDKQPLDDVLGNTWHQMKSQENGMKLCNKNNFIFKGRTDAYCGERLLRTLFENPQKFLKKKSSDKIFKCRIWVPWLEITCPFYMADECIYGFYDDMSKLVHFDRSYDHLWSPHVIRFIHNFRKEYPHLDKYIRNESANQEQHLNLGEKKIEKFMEKFEDERLYYLASYYVVIYKYFRIFTIKEQMRFKNYSDKHDKIDEDKFISNINAENYRIRGLWHSFLIYDDKWIKNVVENKIKDRDEKYDKLHNLISEILQ